MGIMLNTQEVMAAILGGVTIASGIWYAAMYVGKLTVKVDRHEDRLNDHEGRIERTERVVESIR